MTLPFANFFKVKIFVFCSSMSVVKTAPISCPWNKTSTLDHQDMQSDHQIWKCAQRQNESAVKESMRSSPPDSASLRSRTHFDYLDMSEWEQQQRSTRKAKKQQQSAAVILVRLIRLTYAGNRARAHRLGQCVRAGFARVFMTHAPSARATKRQSKGAAKNRQ